MKRLLEHLNYIIQEDFMSNFIGVEDTPSLYNIMQDFFDDKKNNIEHYQWKLIPAEQYHNALKMYMKDGADFKFPEHILTSWLNLICYNVLVLDIFTELAGHSRWFPTDEMNDILFGENEDEYLSEYDEFYDKLESMDFYNWATLPDGTDAISDYGRDPIYRILSELDDFPTKEEMIIAINKCLDVVHQRGDLASAFIEGGSKSCWEISNT